MITEDADPSPWLLSRRSASSLQSVSQTFYRKPVSRELESRRCQRDKSLNTRRVFSPPTVLPFVWEPCQCTCVCRATGFHFNWRRKLAGTVSIGGAGLRTGQPAWMRCCCGLVLYSAALPEEAGKVVVSAARWPQRLRDWKGRGRETELQTGHREDTLDMSPTL